MRVFGFAGEDSIVDDRRTDFDFDFDLSSMLIATAIATATVLALVDGGMFLPRERLYQEHEHLGIREEVEGQRLFSPQESRLSVLSHHEDVMPKDNHSGLQNQNQNQNQNPRPSQQK